MADRELDAVDADLALARGPGRSWAVRRIARGTAAARERLEESVLLRRELGFLPGVAANLVGLAYIAAQEGRRDEALTLVEEAGAIAEASGALGILRSVKEAREQL